MSPVGDGGQGHPRRDAFAKHSQLSRPILATEGQSLEVVVEVTHVTADRGLCSQVVWWPQVSKRRAEMTLVTQGLDATTNRGVRPVAAPGYPCAVNGRWFWSPFKLAKK